MVSRVGMIGMSPENGHPFSFSAIINGYDKESFSKSGWDVILNYLEAKKSMVGIPDLEVTHAWTQDSETTQILADACYIKQVCESPGEMIGEIDAVIIARDDERSHFQLAKPFLENGLSVFIDKPLSLNDEELTFFKPYLEKGKLMSTSGFRYAGELKYIQAELQKIGQLISVQANVVNGFVKYGIHMLDLVSSLQIGRVIKITRLMSEHQAYSFLLDSGVLFNLNCLGEVNKVFRLSFYGEKGFFDCELQDNFTAFKNTLVSFAEMIKTSRSTFNAEEVLRTMCVLQQGQQLKLGESIHL